MLLHTLHIANKIFNELLYCKKLWQQKTLVDLAIDDQFAQVLSTNFSVLP